MWESYEFHKTLLENLCTISFTHIRPQPSSLCSCDTFYKLGFQSIMKSSQSVLAACGFLSKME